MFLNNKRNSEDFRKSWKKYFEETLNTYKEKEEIKQRLTQESQEIALEDKKTSNSLKIGKTSGQDNKKLSNGKYNCTLPVAEKIQYFKQQTIL